MNEIAPPPRRRFGWFTVLLIVLATVALSVATTLWLLKSYFFPDAFRPVALSNREEQVLEQKLERLGTAPPSRAESTAGGGQEAAAGPQPVPYSEEGAQREVTFTERELNALLAHNTDLAKKVAIDLSDDLVSANLLIHVDPDFPILGGKTVRARAGLELAFQNGRPVVRLKGVSVMGVPIPNAWLGGLKNIDLVETFGKEPGFWKSFADGIEELKVEDGRLVVRLKE